LERGIHIFRSEPDAAIARLAQLDSQRPPTSPVLALEIDGQLRAALPLDGGPAIADPFHLTAQLVMLLELRAAQLDQPPHGSRARPLGELRRRMRPAWVSGTRLDTTTASHRATRRRGYGVRIPQHRTTI
jgi:hypothetical protein